jgi:hypothetical protein
MSPHSMFARPFALFAFAAFLVLPATAENQAGAASSKSAAQEAPVQLPALPPVGEKAPVLILENDPSALLGLTLETAINRFGPPKSVSVVRGLEPWQDDAVFAYQGDYSLFWFRDRVWQVRFGKAYAGPILGLFMGDTQDKAVSLLGPADYSFPDSIAYDLKGAPFPVRARLYFADGKLRDAYVYRSDF